jgi:hypothetical protein
VERNFIMTVCYEKEWKGKVVVRRNRGSAFLFRKRGEVKSG